MIHIMIDQARGSKTLAAEGEPVVMAAELCAGIARVWQRMQGSDTDAAEEFRRAILAMIQAQLPFLGKEER